MNFTLAALASLEWGYMTYRLLTGAPPVAIALMVTIGVMVTLTFFHMEKE